MQQTNTTPLWRELRDKIMAEKATTPEAIKYTVMAKNNLHKLAEALEYVLNTIEKSENWWMDCPEKGGFDVDRLNEALTAIS